MQVALFSYSSIPPSVEVAAGAAIAAFERRSGKKAKLPCMDKCGVTKAVSERREKVRALLADGLIQKEIARELDCSKVIISLDVSALRDAGLAL